MLNITDIRMRLVNKEDNKLKAIASITIDGCVVVHEIRVIDGNKGYFVAMPSKKDGNGDYKDIAHPINTATRKTIQDAVLAKYNEVVKDTE